MAVDIYFFPGVVWVAGLLVGFVLGEKILVLTGHTVLVGPAIDFRNLEEIPMWWRSWGGPFEGRGLPRIDAGHLAPGEKGPEEVHDEEELNDRQTPRRMGHYLVQIKDVLGVEIRSATVVQAARHARHADNEHRHKDAVHEDERAP